MSDKSSKFLIGFHKNHNTQHTLPNMIENWKSNLNEGNKIGAYIYRLREKCPNTEFFLVRIFQYSD